jgi:hypothetical protein
VVGRERRISGNPRTRQFVNKSVLLLVLERLRLFSKPACCAARRTLIPAPVALGERTYRGNEVACSPQ